MKTLKFIYYRIKFKEALSYALIARNLHLL